MSNPARAMEVRMKVGDQPGFNSFQIASCNRLLHATELGKRGGKNNASDRIFVQAPYEPGNRLNRDINGLDCFDFRSLVMADSLQEVADLLRRTRPQLPSLYALRPGFQGRDFHRHHSIPQLNYLAPEDQRIFSV
jgi:hypothetical protein